MKKNNLPESIGIFVSLSGLVIMAGWFFGIEILKIILPFRGSMKFSSAFSFFLSGIMLYFIARFKKKDRELAVIIIPIISMVIFILMASLFAAMVLGVSVGIEEILLKDSMIIDGTVAPGRPSVATMLNFFLIATMGILTTMNIKKLNKLLVIFGVMIAVIGLISVLGHSVNQPLLYYIGLGKFRLMAIYSAILFILWGAGAVLVEKNK